MQAELVGKETELWGNFRVIRVADKMLEVGSELAAHPG